MTAWKRARLVCALIAARRKTRTERAVRGPICASRHSAPVPITLSFTDHFGVASLDLGFGGEDAGGGQYHSIYDDFYWYTHFAGHRLRLWARSGANRRHHDDAPRRRRNPALQVHQLRRHHPHLHHRNQGTRYHPARANQGTQYPKSKKASSLLLPTPKNRRATHQKPVPPYLNFAPLDNAADELTRASEAYEKAFSAAGIKPSPELNAKLIKTERLLTNPDGLPNRPWFQNLIYAPGFYTGYGVKTIPGVREAIEQKRWTEAEQQVQIVSKALQNEADLLDEATKDLTVK